MDFDYFSTNIRWALVKKIKIKWVAFQKIKFAHFQKT